MRWIAAVGLAMALLVGDALAWGGEGHRLIGELVYARLSAPARAEIDRLLASDPDGELEGCALRSFADATTWPDCARGKEAYAFSAPFHYDSLPLCGSAPRERYCPDGACATGAIARYRRVLADAARPDAERLEALSFLVHFVQDIHQPLHANANGDRGGNEVRVRFLGEEGFLGRDGQLRPFNLHGVWDTRLLPHVLKPDGSGRGEIAAMVDAYGELWRATSVSGRKKATTGPGAARNGRCRSRSPAGRRRVRPWTSTRPMSTRPGRWSASASPRPPCAWSRNSMRRWATLPTTPPLCWRMTLCRNLHGRLTG